jgi:hypothetical protein
VSFFVGEAILWAEAKLGELLKKMGPGLKTLPPGKPYSFKSRLKRPEGISKSEAYQAYKLAKHPEVIKEVL